MMISAFLKETTRPLESVKRPSSSNHPWRTADPKASESVLQNLKHEIEHIWVCLLDLVEKDEALDH